MAKWCSRQLDLVSVLWFHTDHQGPSRCPDLVTVVSVFYDADYSLRNINRIVAIHIVRNTFYFRSAAHPLYYYYSYYYSYYSNISPRSGKRGRHQQNEQNFYHRYFTEYLTESQHYNSTITKHCGEIVNGRKQQRDFHGNVDNRATKIVNSRRRERLLAGGWTRKETHLREA